MRYHATPLLALLAITAGASAQQPPKRNQDPEAARLVTSDIPNFWRVFDKVSLKDAAELFQREYRSAGLRDFVESRIETGRYLAGTIAARPRYYAAIRASTLAGSRLPGCVLRDWLDELTEWERSMIGQNRQPAEHRGPRVDSHPAAARECQNHTVAAGP